MGAEAGRRAVDGRDHRLLAVEDGGDQALRAEADDAGHVTGDPLPGGLSAASSFSSAASSQVRARAETPARAGEDDGSYGGVGGGVREKLDEAFSLVRGDGVEGFGAVEGDPRDLIVSGVQYQ
ncbi:hypothetical protein GCM10009540_24240 [Streptomyces turgidiscabies]